MNRKLFLIWLLFICLFPALAQERNENLIDKVELRFSLDGQPTPVAVGFDNPKSYWKLKYELYLADFSDLEKIGRCRKDEVGRYICLPNLNKKLNKKIRKSSMKIIAGNFTKKFLAADANREVVIPVNLQQDILDIFNRAVKDSTKNPSFILFVSTKAATKNSAKEKFKKKYSTDAVKPLKTGSSVKDYEFWDIRKISLSLEIIRQENGKMTGLNGFIH